MSADEDTDNRSRRSYDDILPVVMLKVEEKVAETRHLLRSEQVAATLSVINRLDKFAVDYATAQAQASREHEQVRADIAELKHCVEDLMPMKVTVGELQRVDIADKSHADALTHMRRTMWKVCGLVIAGIGVVNAVVVTVLAN